MGTERTGDAPAAATRKLPNQHAPTAVPPDAGWQRALTDVGWHPPTGEANAGGDGQARVILTGAPGPGVAGVRDGSTPETAIPVTAAEVLQGLTAGEIAGDVLRPDAIALGFRGSIGVQDIPGWNSIPGLRELGRDAQVGYLGAILAPYRVLENGRFSPSVSLSDSTLFLSISIPGRTPLIITTRPGAGNFEVGAPVGNWISPNRNWILFSNARLGATLSGPDAVGSINGGILRRIPNMSDIRGGIRAVRTFVTGLTRAIEAGEIATAITAAPGSAATSLATGALSIAATETLRGAVFRSLARADIYGGVAWRASASAGIHDGHLTLVAQKGPHAGRWIDVNVSDLPADLFRGLIPNFVPANELPFIDRHMSPEVAHQFATFFGTPDRAWSFLRQTAEYINRVHPNPINPATVDNLLAWFNDFPPDRLQGFFTMQVGTVRPETGDRYGTALTVAGQRFRTIVVAQSIADMVRAAAAFGRPMPNSPWTQAQAAGPLMDFGLPVPH
jgi:hypothetical protein